MVGMTPAYVGKGWRALLGCRLCSLAAGVKFGVDSAAGLRTRVPLLIALQVSKLSRNAIRALAAKQRFFGRPTEGLFVPG